MNRQTPDRQPESTEAHDASPWYRDGLRFECTQCGACCSGEPGYVFVDDDEIEKMVSAMAMTRDDFERKFLRQVGTRTSLVEYPDGDCIFLDPKSRGCLIYEARPIQCRTWPFWNSTLRTAQDWADTCQECPGAGQGRLYSLGQIESRRQEKNV